MIKDLEMEESILDYPGGIQCNHKDRYKSEGEEKRVNYSSRRCDYGGKRLE